MRQPEKQFSGCFFLQQAFIYVEITSHNNGDTVQCPFLISGTASDKGGLNTVEYRIDSGEYAKVEGLEKWKVLITSLASGKHYVTVKAADYNDNTEYSYLEIIIE
jgi:hypothetical protein